MLDSTQFSLFIEPGSHSGAGSTQMLLTDPGDLLASLPALFGFYPDRSVIFSTFVVADSAFSTQDEPAVSAEGQGGTAQRLELGASFRLDVADLELLPNLAEYIDTLSPKVVLAFLIGEYSHEEQERIGGTLRLSSEQGLLPLDGMWHTPRIHTGCSYQRLFGGITPVDQDYGVISDIASTAAMRSAREKSEGPALDREALFNTFAPTWDVLTEEESEDLAHSAHQRVQELIRLAPQELDDLLGFVAEDACLIIKQAASVCQGDSRGHTLFADPEDLGTLATYLLKAPFRDALLPLALDYPTTVRALALEIARNTSGDIRTNALCWYAIAATADTLANRAFPALMTALEENPQHSLSSLLLTALRLGRSDYVTEAIDYARRRINAREQRDCDLQDPGCTPKHPR